ncbi:hypothetical protein HYH03_011024 [Edaphochlamys debaryana]|uniref:SHSP domain-containing protein n=1 Tax=Edaphochlamys debaryana TaxID=47281 RepID=A0A836BWY1_9CHLO|nr:hypothetical protein HYH03_011024 [Edaphochlamys debaryana]|eukprot:KAG2490633.1 hypothetical protein HYH03_011024 [Edaphochlamys debaryana]
MALTMKMQRTVASSQKSSANQTRSGAPRIVAIPSRPRSAIRPQAFFVGPVVRGSCRSPTYYRAPLSSFGLSDALLADASRWLRESATNASHPVNIQKFDDRYELNTDCPGMADEDVAVEVSPDRVLTIAGSRKTAAKPAPKPDPTTSDSSEPSATPPEKKGEAEAPGPSYSVSYRFQRSFGLPEDADVEGVEASLERGVLSVRIPRKQAEKAQPRRVSIKGAGQGKTAQA